MYCLRKLVTVSSALWLGWNVRVSAVTTSPPQSRPALVATSPASPRGSSPTSADPDQPPQREDAHRRQGSRSSTSCRSRRSRRGSGRARTRASCWCGSRSPGRGGLVVRAHRTGLWRVRELRTCSWLAHSGRSTPKLERTSPLVQEPAQRTSFWQVKVPYSRFIITITSREVYQRPVHRWATTGGIPSSPCW